METNELKLKTLLFFFNAMKELNTAVDRSLVSLNNKQLTDQEKFNQVLAMLGDYGLNQNFFADKICDPEPPKVEIGGPIQKFDYHTFIEEQFEILLQNGLICIGISLN